MSTWLDNGMSNIVKADQTNISIWNNTNIVYQNNVLFYENWTRKQIVYVRDIMNNVRIMSVAEITSKLGNWANNQLEYNVISTAVRRYLRRRQLTLTDHMTTDKNRTHMSAKAFRLLITESHHSNPVCEALWKRKLNVDIGKWHWTIAKHITKKKRSLGTTLENP